MISERLDGIAEQLDVIIELLQTLVDQTAEPEIGDYTPMQPPQLTPVDPMDDPMACPRCKMPFRGVMGYVCQDVQCPMGCGPTVCSSQ